MFRTLDDIGDVTGKRVLVRVGPQRADGRWPRRRRVAAGGNGSDDRRLWPTAARKSSSCRTSGGPRASIAALSLRPVAAALGRRARTAGSRSPPTASARSPPLRSLRCRTAGSSLSSRIPASTRARRRTTPAFVAALATKTATSTSTTPSPPRTAPTPRPRGWRTSSPPSPVARWRPSSTALDKALGSPGPSRRGGGRRGEGVVEARCADAPSRNQGGSFDHRRRDGEYLPRRQGRSRSARRLCEHDMTATALDVLARAEAAHCTVHLPYDVVVATEFRAHAPHRTANVHEIDAWRNGPRPRPRRRRGARRRPQDLPHPGLERPARRVRANRRSTPRPLRSPASPPR